MTDSTFEVMLEDKMQKSNHGQMTAEEYRYIGSFLCNKNFLIFGTGHDTPLWRYANNNGLCVFLENKSKWINKEDTDVYKVKYTTSRGQYKQLLREYQNNNYINLQIDLPDIVKNTEWDCIFVDSPVGTSDKQPGRMQSIFSASDLASSNTEVFVHDIDRIVEDVYTREMFSLIIKDLTKLRHVRL